MVRLFFDIETIPCDEDKKEMFLDYLKAKSGNGSKEDDDLHSLMSFDGALGRICCIGYIKEGHGKIERGMLSGDEKEMLRQFWVLAADVERFIGHNIYEFDLPFIYKRSIILGVKTRSNISFARYRNFPIFDTMREWDLWGDSRRSSSLDKLARVMGFPTSKDEMDGSQVWSYFKDGRMNEIMKYCMKDVELNRKVYYRMVFEDIPEAVESSDDINF